MSAEAATSYHVSLNDEAHVPMTREQIASVYKDGLINERTLVWRKGMEQWARLEEMARELDLKLKPKPVIQKPEHKPLRPSQGVKIERRRKNWRASIRFTLFWAFMAFCVIMLLITWGNKADISPFQLERQAKDIVLGMLKAPKTAEVTVLSNTQFQNTRTFRGYVDAQNGFGAMLRTNWEVEFTKPPKSESWTLSAFQLGKDRVDRPRK